MKKIVLSIIGVFILVLCYLGFKYITNDQYITSEEAKQIAIEDVSNKDGKYTFISVEFKETNDIYIYILEFSDKVNSYTYKINAKTKKIISSKKEYLANDKIFMKEDDILNIVFKHAKLAQSECNLISNLVTNEGDISIYTTVFYYNNIKYEYKTNAFTGSIISVSKLSENAE